MKADFVRQMLVGIAVFWAFGRAESHVRPPHPIVGDFFLSAATDRGLLGSKQDRLVLKENKTKKADVSECNERDQPISVQLGERLLAIGISGKSF